VRLRKSDLPQRVNADLALRYEHNGLTSFAGLEFLQRYFCQIQLRSQIRRWLSPYLPNSDFGIPGLVLAILILIITGGRRLRHLGYLQSDPLVLRSCGLHRLPTDHTAGRWLAKFEQGDVDRLRQWNEEIVRSGIQACGLRRLTIDVDGSVVSTGLSVEGAKRGFNPHRRKVPSYYPITAYEANTSQILRVHNRPGNVHDGKASIEFLDELVAQLKRTELDELHWEVRFDGAFFRADVIDRLEHWGAEYAIKVPFYRWLDLQSVIAKRCRWFAVDDQVDYFETTLWVDAWQCRLPVVIYRKRVGHQSRKNYQLDLFDPDDGYYEYSAILSNKSVTGRTLWYFMCGRGTHEKTYAELKTGFAFASVPTYNYQANSAWQVFSILAFNLIRGFQAATIAEPRTANRKRRPLKRFLSIQTLRFNCLNRAGLMVQPQGRGTLDVGTAPTVRAFFEKMEHALQKAA
jgi:hypothetical protein